MYKASKYNISLDYHGRTFIFNAVSSAGAFVESSLDNDVINSKLSDDELSVLLDNHFIVPFELDEERVESEKTYDALYGNYFTDQLFVIAPTLECNANCDYCFEKGKRIHSDMSKETQRQVLDYIEARIAAHKETKISNITFFGGEPTLKIELIEELSSAVQHFCITQGVEYNARIITNGILLSKDNCRKLRDAGVDMCQITVDGMRKTWARKKGLPESLFDNVIENIKYAVDAGLRVLVKVNIDNSNKAEIPQLMRLLFEEERLNGKIRVVPAQIKKWNDSPLDNYMTDSDYFDALSSYRTLAIKNNWYKSFDVPFINGKVASCGMVRNAAVGIRYDGKLYRCEHCFANDEIDGCATAIGDISVGVYDNEIDKSFRRETAPKNSELDSCVKCAYYPICHGGCRAQILINKQETNCETLKKDVILRLIYKLQIRDQDRKKGK